ncbi:conserved hypothetical protein [Burkholderia sp. H160]|nr:conserved hypothetical protein [Burkholderia sp. H160]
MRVRAVAAALAVWCVSEAALAAGYAEVWNPPEASGHAARQAHARKKPGAVKVEAGAKGGVKAQAGAHAKQTASVQHGAPHHVASGGTGHVGKLSVRSCDLEQLAASGNAKGGVKGGARGGMKVAATGQHRTPASATARHAQPHVQLAHANPAPGKVVHANFAAGHTGRPHVDKVAAKPAVSGANPTKPHVQTSPDASANVSEIEPMGSEPNPATARSGSLPPMIY